MKKLLLIFFILFSYTTSVYAQEPAMLWLKGYGGDQGAQVLTHVTATQDGGFIIALETSSDVGTGNIDSLCTAERKRVIFVKYNADASVMEWTKCYGFGGDSTLLYLFPTNDGGFVLGGEGGFLICKEDALGTIIWSRNYGISADVGLIDMIATDDGGYLMVGNCYFNDTNFTVYNSGSFLPSIAVLKLDSLGNKQWSKAIGGSYVTEALSVIPGPNGGCYIFGGTTCNDYDCTGLHGPPNTAADAYLVRLDSKGNIIWHHDLGGSGIDGDYGWGVANNKGGVVLAASSYSLDGDVHHHIGQSDYWVLEVDSSNNILWDNSYGSISQEVPFAICKADDGSIWITGGSGQKGGEVDTAYGQGDAWIVHVDSLGNFLSAKVLGSSEIDEGYMIYPLSGGGVITGGTYSKGDDCFSSFPFYGIPSLESDAFLGGVAPYTTGVKQISINSGIKVYPNPTHEQVIVETQKQDTYTIVLTDVLGQKVYQARFTGKINIAVNEWLRGIYYVQVVSEDGQMATRKLLIK